MAAPGQALPDTFLQTVEMLRDTSHVRNYSPAEWARLSGEAGLLVTGSRRQRLRLEFQSWVERMRTPEVFRQAIRSLQLAVGEEVREYFEIATTARSAPTCWCCGCVGSDGSIAAAHARRSMNEGQEGVMSKQILVLPGDGIGPEIMAEAVKVLELANDRFQLGFELAEDVIGGAAIDKHGVPLADQYQALSRDVLLEDYLGLRRQLARAGLDDEARERLAGMAARLESWLALGGRGDQACPCGSGKRYRNCCSRLVASAS